MACGNDDCPKMHVRVQVGRQWATGVFHTLADARAFAAGYQHIARTERKARGVVFTVLAGCDNHEIASWTDTTPPPPPLRNSANSAPSAFLPLSSEERR